MNKPEEKQNGMDKNQKGEFWSGFLSYFPAWSILISVVFGYWSIFYVLGQFQGRHLFILTLSTSSAAVAVFVGHMIFFAVFLGLLFIVPYGLLREIAVIKHNSDLQWGVFCIFSFFFL